MPDTQAAVSDSLAQQGQTPQARPHRARNIAIAVALVIVLVVAGVFGFLFYKGALAPGSAAAKYGTFEYVYEDEVSDYIMEYKTQMGYGEASDEEWASFLAAYNMTPERLRASTVDQLVIDKLVRKNCKEYGITAEESEVQEALDYYKSLYASGSDDIWAETLEMYGQTEEGFKEMLELNILKEKLCEEVVETPEPSEDEVRTVISAFVDNAVSNDRSLTLKHSYCFKKAKSSEEGSLEEREEVEKIRDGLVSVGASEESFASIIDLYCDDEGLRETSGANGWNADTSGYTEEYIGALDTVDEGAVSAVFADEDSYFFIWISDTYTLPKKSEKVEDLDLAAIPEALLQYFEDMAAYTLWQTNAQEYLANLSSTVEIIYYDMPADVPYNVDMSIIEASDDDNDEIGDDSAETDDSATEGEEETQQ